jgi:hypothetical protein
MLPFLKVFRNVARGTPAAQRTSMIVTALLIFLGLSTCATMTIVAAVMLGARRGRVAYATPASETAHAHATVMATA